MFVSYNNIMNMILELVIFLIIAMALIALSIYIIVKVKYGWIGVVAFWLLVGAGYIAYEKYPKGTLLEQYDRNYRESYKNR